MRFTKMHAAGNDYIYFDCTKVPFRKDPAEIARRLSDRHFGVGGDGIILILPSSVADCRMRIFNADGSEGAMCGNGVRCVGYYAREHFCTRSSFINVETESGIKTVFFIDTKNRKLSVGVKMGAASFEASAVPALLPCPAGDFTVGEDRAVCVSVGNPHCVIFTDDIENYPLAQTAKDLVDKGYFPEGVNTEIVSLRDGVLCARVYERGSGETLACGTGACATAAAAVKLGLVPAGKLTVRLPGGELGISVDEDFGLVLEGPVETVYEGRVEL